MTSGAIAQAEDVKHSISSAKSSSEPVQMAGHLMGLSVARTTTFFASFFTAGSAEPVITHPAPKGTCGKATVLLADGSQYRFSIIFWGINPREAALPVERGGSKAPRGGRKVLGLLHCCPAGELQVLASNKLNWGGRGAIFVFVAVFHPSSLPQQLCSLETAIQCFCF